jgi:hypothetical protein
MNEPMIGGVAKVDNYDLLPEIPDRVKTVPAPPVVNPFDNPTPNPSNPSSQAVQAPFDASVHPDLLIAGDDEWEWATELLGIWYDPAVEDKEGLATQMHELLGVMMNEVRAQAAQRQAPLTPADWEVTIVESESTTMWHGTVEKKLDYVNGTANEILATIKRGDANDVDRNALSMAVMQALIGASDNGGNATQVMAMTTAIVNQVCGDA